MEQFRNRDWNPRKSVQIQTFADCRIFWSLSLGEIREISDHATAVRYSKGSSIFEVGDPAEYLYIVQEGSVKLHGESPSGKGLTFEISKSGDTLNGSALSTERYFVSAQALTEVTVVRIRRDDFFGFVARFPNLALEIIHLQSSRLKREYMRMIASQKGEAEQRVCRSLFALTSKFGPTLSLKREEIAEYAGTTTETTIRVLGKLKRAGILSCSQHRGKIVVADVEKLRSAVADAPDQDSRTKTK